MPDADDQDAEETKRAVRGAGVARGGARIGKCRIISEIGRGGMGAVFRAHHLSLDIDVALKVISFEAATEADRAECIARFQREARSAAKVRHENVVAILDVDQDAGRHYMIMELIDGVSARRLVEDGPLPPAEAARIVRDAALALGAAHAQGIVHRDVKPENILVTRDGRVKVSDSGIAHVGTEREARLTRTGQIVGTPHYMSPEQVEGGPLDGRADIYSLGASLFHLVTGTLPYSGPSALQVCMKHVSAPVPSPIERKPGLPLDLSLLICRMMAKDPRERFQSAGEVARALEPFAGPRRPLDSRIPGVVAVRTDPGPAVITPAGAAASPADVTAPMGTSESRARGTPAPAEEARVPPRGHRFLVPAVVLAVLAGAAGAIVIPRLVTGRPRPPTGAEGTVPAGAGSTVPAGTQGVVPRGQAGAAASPSGATVPDTTRVQNATMLLQQAFDHMAANRVDAAILAFDGVAALDTGEGGPALKQVAASALLSAAQALEREGRPKEALERAERLARDYAEASPLIAREAKKLITRLRPLASAEDSVLHVQEVLACEVASFWLVASDLDGDGRPDVLATGNPGACFLTGGTPGGGLAERAWPGTEERRKPPALRGLGRAGAPPGSPPARAAGTASFRSSRSTLQARPAPSACRRRRSSGAAGRATWRSPPRATSTATGRRTSSSGTPMTPRSSSGEGRPREAHASPRRARSRSPAGFSGSRSPTSRGTERSRASGRPARAFSSRRDRRSSSPSGHGTRRSWTSTATDWRTS